MNKVRLWMYSFWLCGDCR